MSPAFFRNRAIPVIVQALAVFFFPSMLRAAPTIQSVTVQPSALVVGQPFTVVVAASPTATQGTATVDFRPWATRVMRLVLVKQGANWLGTGTVPSDLVPPTDAKVTITAIMLDAARGSVSVTITADVKGPPVASATATFAGGILTVTGTPQNDTLQVSRTAAGALLVNNGAIPITGGVPTVDNTTLVRILGLAGDDVLGLDETNGALPASEMFGAEGNDILRGGSQTDRLDGGPGNDQLIGGRGNDLLFGGAGDDGFAWSPGDGNDTLEGEGGTDTLVFNGTNISENFGVSANGARFTFTRDVANITLDCAGIERVVVNTAGGSDHVVVNNLSGAGLSEIRVDLSASGTPGTGDGQADLITVNGTDAADMIAINSTTNTTTLTGLGTTVVVTGADAALDTLAVNGLGGDDVIDASASVADAKLKLMLNGGDGDDIILGGAGADVITGGRGNDVVLAGGGDDLVTWSPGDANDTIEGQAGVDTLLFTTSNVGENLALTANGGRVRLFRDVANVTLDCNGVEEFDLQPLGGSDHVIVNDLTGTGVTHVEVDLAVGGGRDGQPDTVTINGSAGDDVMTVTGSVATGVSLATNSTTVSITGADADIDRLIVNSLGGDDALSASGLTDGVLRLTMSGGDGDDVLIGSDGGDVLLGDAGDDVLIGGPGLDILDGGTGSNVIIQ